MFRVFYERGGPASRRAAQTSEEFDTLEEAEKYALKLAKRGRMEEGSTEGSRYWHGPKSRDNWFPSTVRLIEFDPELERDW